MEEEEILVLEANGYSLDTSSGAILDSDGVYVKNVKIGDFDLYSPLGEQEHMDVVEANESFGKKISLEEEINNFKEKPLNNNLSEEAKNYYPTYMEDNPVAENDFEYDDVESFKEDVENKEIEKKNEDPLSENPMIGYIKNAQNHLGKDIIPDAHIEEFKELDKYIKEVETKDKGILEAFDNVIKEKDAEWENAPIYRVDRLALSLATGVLGTAAKTVISPFADKMTGTDIPEEEREKYREAVKRRKELKTVPLTNMRESIKQQREALQKKREEVDKDDIGYSNTKELTKLDVAIRMLAQSETSVTDELEGNTYDPLKSEDEQVLSTLYDFISFGTSDLAWQQLVDASIHSKVEKGEKLSEIDKLYAEALASSNYVNSRQKDMHWSYDLLQGTVESLKFLAGRKLGTMAFNGISGKLATTVSKKLVRTGSEKFVDAAGEATKTAMTLGKIAAGTATAIPAALLHPQTYIKSFDKYHGTLRYDLNAKDEAAIFTNDRRDYNIVQGEIRNNILDLQDMLAKKDIPSSQKRMILDEITKEKDKLKTLAKPVSGFDSFAYGYTETLKEQLVEDVVGAGTGLLLKPATEGATEVAKKWITRSKSAESALVKKNLIKKGKSIVDTYNKYLGNKVTSQIGGVGEEMYEEVVTQLLPVYGETDAEAKQRIAQLFDPHFYGMVAGQTLLMRGAMQGKQSIQNSPRNLGRYYKDRKDSEGRRKLFEETLKDMKKSGFSESKVSEMLMKIGGGNQTVQEYNNSINDLRRDGKNKEADRLEQDKLYNTAKSIISLDKSRGVDRVLGKSYIKDLRNAVAEGKDLSPEAAHLIEGTIKEIEALESVASKYAQAPNKELLLEITSKNRYTNSQIRELESKKSELQETLGKDVENDVEINKSIDHLEEHIKEKKDATAEFDKEFEKASSEEHQESLMLDLEIESHAMEAYLDAEKKHKKTLKKGEQITSEDYENFFNSAVEITKGNYSHRASEKRVNKFKKKLAFVTSTYANNALDKQDNALEAQKTREEIEVAKERKKAFGDRYLFALDTKIPLEEREKRLNKSLEKELEGKKGKRLKKLQDKQEKIKEFFNEYKKTQPKSEEEKKKEDEEILRKKIQAKEEEEEAKLKQQNNEMPPTPNEEFEEEFEQLPPENFGNEFTDTPKVVEDIVIEEDFTEPQLTINFEESVGSLADPLDKDTEVTEAMFGNLEKEKEITGEEVGVLGESSSPETADISLNLGGKSQEKEEDESEPDMKFDFSPATSRESSEDFDKRVEQMRSEFTKRLKISIDALEAILGHTPTFSQYIDEVISLNVIPMDNMKNYLQGFGLVYSQVTGQPSYYLETYNKLSRTMQELHSLPTLPTSLTEKVQKSSDKVLDDQTTISPIKYTPVGEAVTQGEDRRKVYDKEIRLRYSAVEHDSAVVSVNGRLQVVYTEKPYPTLATNNIYDIRDLVHPEKNNVGTILSVATLKGRELGEHLVTVKNEDITQPDTYMTFKDWVDANQGDMPFEEFEKTPEYIGKVPIVFKYPNGKNANMLPETDWYNLKTIGDNSIEESETDLANPTKNHLESIEAHKQESLELRRSILSGDITEFTIADNLGSTPLEKISGDLPSVNLNTMFPDSRVVYMTSGGDIKTLSGEAIAPRFIMNYGDASQGYRQEMQDDNKGSKPVHALHTAFLVHRTTTESGQKLYEIFSTLSKDENGKEKAHAEDIETVKWMSAASVVINDAKLKKDKNRQHEVSKDKSHPYYMELADAKRLQKQILKEYRIDITGASGLAYMESLVVMRKVSKDSQTGKNVVSGIESSAKNFKYTIIKSSKQNPGTLMYSDAYYRQNTKFTAEANFRRTGGKPFSISKTDAGVSANPISISSTNQDGTKKTAKSYEDLLKERLSTNIVGFDVGTEGSPKHTHAVQQQIILKPNINDSKTVKEKIEENIEEVHKNNSKVSEKVEEVEKGDKTVEELSSEKRLRRKEVMERATKLALELNLNVGDTNLQDNLVISEMTTDEHVAKNIGIVPGLTVKQEGNLVAWLFSKLAKKGASKEEVLDAFGEEVTTRSLKLAETIEELREFEDNDVVLNMSSVLNTALNQLEAVKEGDKRLLREALLQAKNTSFIEDDQLEDETLNERNFSKSASENTAIDKVGTAVKRVFAQVSNQETGFMGFTTYTSFKTMYDNVGLILSSSYLLEPDFNTMMKILKEREDSVPWMKPLIAELESSDEQTKNQFVYNAYRQKIDARFATISLNKEGGVVSSLYRSNSNEAARAVQESWYQGFNRSPINSGGVINRKVLEDAVEMFNRWQNSGKPYEQPSEEYKQFLELFGINLSEDTLKGIINGELKTTVGGRVENASFNTLFQGYLKEKPLSRKGNPMDRPRGGNLFSSLVNYAQNSLDVEKELNFLEEKGNHPFSDMSSILEQLAQIEIKYNTSYSSTTRYVNGKLNSELELHTYMYEQIKKLKRGALSENDNYLERLSELSFQKDSKLLQLLQNDPIFAQKFGGILVDSMSLKELYKKNPMFSQIDELSSFDYMYTTRAGFQNRDSGSTQDYGDGIGMRLSQMSTPTNSDKGRMMMLQTMVYDLYAESDKAFEISDTGDITFSDTLNDILFEQMVSPELRRMVSFISKDVLHKSNNQGKNYKTNVKSYDKGAVRFNIIPGLNQFTNLNKENVNEYIERRAEELLAEGLSEKEINEEILEGVRNNYGNKYSRFIADNVIKEASNNVDKLEDFVVQKNVSGEVVNTDAFNNAEYLSNRKGSIKQNMMVSEMDYIINYMISNMNYMQLVAGDPALYYKAKGDSSDKSLSNQESMSKQIAINIGKRMASMIAPGNVLANSKGKTYRQIVLNDAESPTEHLAEIVGIHYGKGALKKTTNLPSTGKKHSYGNLIKRLNSEDTPPELKKEIQGVLEDTFDSVRDFINIEATDAQEYTTVKEHLYILENQGRIPTRIIKEIKDKIRQQEEYFSIEGNTYEDMPKSMDLSTVVHSNNKALDGLTQLEIILQPLKPVYTGTSIDLEQDLNRMVYVKSSSFPLVPQSTVGTGLDVIRKKMEKFGVDRAAYQTAVKVGSLTGDLAISDFNEDIREEQVLTLQREHFKIQQDVPHKIKSGVSMGTQMFKLLMGDGITELKDFEYEGKPMTGKQLQEELLSVFSEMVGIKREKFLESMGYDSNMKSKDPYKSLRKLEKLLIAEGKSRGFSKQDLKILEIDTNTRNFRMPLWMTGNSNKYESMLNAMVNNKVFKQKIPGNKFVAASSHGFKAVENLGKKTLSRIIHINGHTGGELQGGKSVDGKFQKAQIYIPSKFSLEGKLIDLYQDYNKDTKEGTYIKEENGRLVLKEDMIDKKLFEQFAFRIPTSSHGLGSAVEIAGILPPESGDMIVTPKGFVAQMGQDFDVDSLTTYQYNHIIVDKKIKVLNRESKNLYIQSKRREIKELKEFLDKEGVIGLQEDFEGKSLSDKSSFGDLPLDLLKEATTVEEAKEMLAGIEKGLEKDFSLKILENKFIAIHNSVFTNPKAQSRIQKALSMKYAEDQAEDIENLSKKSDNTFNILSPKYQMDKLNAGSTGKVAIGIYAKGLTLHSLLQQTPKPLRMVDRYMGSEGKLINRPSSYTIGNLRSTGVLGESLTISPENSVFKHLRRRVSTVLDERANTATDNEKAQILGRTGLNNKDALAVDSFLVLLGYDSEFEELDKFEKGTPFHRKGKDKNGEELIYKEYNIPYLLHSQPIVREYFDKVNKKQSIVVPGFSSNPRKEALDEILKDYSNKKGATIKKGEYGIESGDVGNKEFKSLQDNTIFTGKVLASQIEGDVDKDTQLQVLAMYLDLVEQSKVLKETMENVDMNNLGKSMWESSTKTKNFREFFTNKTRDPGYGLSNPTALVGEFTRNTGTIEEGHLDIGSNVSFKPTTNQGVMVGTAVSLSENLFNDLFPAQSPYVNAIIDKILDMSVFKDSGDYATIGAKEKIFQEIKKYLSTDMGLGLSSVEATKVRQDLMIDDVVRNHESLSTYLGNSKHAKINEETREGQEILKSNLFLSVLKYKMGEGGKPSTVEFNNQESFEVSQEEIYSSVKELFENDLPLPNKNGERYTTRILAQELVAYSYMTGGIVQGALEFHKYLPVDYLEDMIGFGGKSSMEILRSYAQMNQNKNYGMKPGENLLKDFVEQYFQNNPESAPQAKYRIKAELDGKTVFFMNEKELKEMEYKNDGKEVEYITLKNRTKSKLKQDKYTLLRLIGEGIYEEIDVLGERGMAEYQKDETDVKSILGNTANGNSKTQTFSHIDLNIVKNLKNKEVEHLPEEGTKIVDYLNAVENGQTQADESSRAIAGVLKNNIDPNYEINYVNGEQTFVGAADRKTGEVSIAIDMLNSDKDFNTTLNHEVVHNITTRYLEKYMENGDLKIDPKTGEYSKDIPEHVLVLNRVFLEYKKGIENNFSEELKEFKEKYKSPSTNKEGIPTDNKLTKREVDLFYPTINLKEFIATTMGNNGELLAAANQMPSGEKSTVLSRLASAWKSFIKELFFNGDMKVEEGTVAFDALSASLVLIESVPREYKYRAQKPIFTNNNNKGSVGPPPVSSTEIDDDGYGDADYGDFNYKDLESLPASIRIEPTKNDC